MGQHQEKYLFYETGEAAENARKLVQKENLYSHRERKKQKNLQPRYGRSNHSQHSSICTSFLTIIRGVVILPTLDQYCPTTSILLRNFFLNPPLREEILHILLELLRTLLIGRLSSW